jgi:hypothetical protein
MACPVPSSTTGTNFACEIGGASTAKKRCAFLKPARLFRRYSAESVSIPEVFAPIRLHKRIKARPSCPPLLEAGLFMPPRHSRTCASNLRLPARGFSLGRLSLLASRRASQIPPAIGPPVPSRPCAGGLISGSTGGQTREPSGERASTSAVIKIMPVIERATLNRHRHCFFDA